MKAYVILISDILATRGDVQKFLDTIYEVSYWYSCLPNCIFCTSSLTANEIAGKIRKHFGNKRFLVMECNSNSQGWLPKEAWHLMNNPYHPKLN